MLGRFCRAEKLLSWELAVHKMTGQTAAKLGLKERGLLRQGYAADFAIFNPTTVKDEATYTDPHRHPTGIPYVIVNGQVVVDDGRMNAAPAGKVLQPAK